MIKFLTYSSLLLNTLSFTPHRALEQQYTDFRATIPVTTILSGGTRAVLACDFGISSLVDDDMVSQTDGYTPEMYFVFQPYISQWNSSPSDYNLDFNSNIFEENFSTIESFRNNLDYIEFKITSSWSKSSKKFNLIFDIDYYFTDDTIENYQFLSSDEMGSLYTFDTTYSISGVVNYNCSYKIYKNQLYNYYDIGVTDGYDDGLNANSNTQTFLDNVWTFVDNATTAVFNVLDIQILPGVPLYSIVIIPLCI